MPDKSNAGFHSNKAAVPLALWSNAACTHQQMTEQTERLFYQPIKVSSDLKDLQ
jgi:hypothetical protein